MKLVLISPSRYRTNEVAQLVKMFEMGLPVYHIRKNSFSTKELKAFIEEIPARYHPRLVIHSHHELALKFNLGGIYLSRTHKKKKLKNKLRLWWIKYKKPSLTYSTTVRSLESLFDTTDNYNYVFIAPVFDSTKGNFQAGFRKSNLQNVLQKNRFNALARGGITADKILTVEEMGFAGMAFSSYVWKDEKPCDAFQRVLERFAELKIPFE